MMVKPFAMIIAASVTVVMAVGVGWLADASTWESGSDPDDTVSADAIMQQTVMSPYAMSATATAKPDDAGGPPAGVKLSRQSFQRGGLGANALMSFTVHNENAYAVKDIGLLCTFTSKDGRYVTLRRKTIPEPISFKERKTFARVHVGFVNTKATRARCSLLAATPV
jgi:hypothetical protein